MGGGTWVYLGTFDFGEGCSKNNCVVLNNVCSKDGVVTADAVRFGGGMGNIRRGESVSGMPRALEGARYAAQWYGAPQEVYSSKEGRDDYGDDVNARALISNWWAGGSVFLPTKSGLGIPIELCLGIHSDAGADRRSKNIVGSLAICTSYFNDGRLATGVTRNLSVSFAESMLETIHHDLNRKFGRWEVRELIDKNYSETRMPEIPSAILETLSHQNFPDMRLGHDPNFKFALARAVYKSILRFMCNQHGTTATVTPLAPSYFHINYLYNGQIKLGWRETNDELDALANIDFHMRTESQQFRQLELVRLGTCGGLQPHCPEGTFIASRKSLGFDGLLNFYDGRNEVCDLEFEKDDQRERADPHPPRDRTQLPTTVHPKMHSLGPAHPTPSRCHGRPTPFPITDEPADKLQNCTQSARVHSEMKALNYPRPTNRLHTRYSINRFRRTPLI